MDKTINWAHWKDLPEGQIRAFAKLFSEYKSQELIANVNTQFKLLKIADDIYLPVTINDEEWENSFVCSPFTAYALYSKDELMLTISNKLIQFPLLLVIKLLGKWLKWGQLNKNIHVNNFLLSTNPYPTWHGEEIELITEFIKQKYPNHAIIFRSLNTTQHTQLLSIFEQKNYQLIASRQLYMFDLTMDNWLKHRNNKHDNKLIKKKKLIFLDHAEMSDYIEQALQLYYKLYLKKYSQYNPQFTLNYFKKCYSENLIYFQGYKDENNILKAFSGLFIIGDTITSPLVGYDTDAPKSDGLYIHCAQLAILYKLKSDLSLNLSSGAAEFKRLRGCVPAIEYSAIYIQHLSFKRRVTWLILTFISNKIGVPLLKKYKL